MIGAALASSMAASDSDPRMELLCWCCSREVISPCSGVAATTTPAMARPARTTLSMASRPRAASRTARYTAVSATPTQTVRFSDQTSGIRAAAAMTSAHLRCRLLP